MREIELFRQYLQGLRRERLQQEHMAAMNAIRPEDMMHVFARAHEAEIVSRVLGALGELDQDSGEFTKKYLQ